MVLQESEVFRNRIHKKNLSFFFFGDVNMDKFCMRITVVLDIACKHPQNILILKSSKKSVLVFLCSDFAV